MRKSTLVVAVLAIAMATTLAFAGTKANLPGSPHDIGSNGCFACHAPHSGSTATGIADTLANQSTGKILLWDRNFTSVTFGVYTSPSLDNATAEVGTTTPTATEPRLFSFLCLSCHDGVTSPTVIGPTDTSTSSGLPIAVGNLAQSAGLENDHPINMTYDPALDTGLDTVANITNPTTGKMVLFGTTDTVQCATCHDVHDNTNTPFLRKANTNSALCLTCHL